MTERQTLVCRTPEDILTVVPAVLGFAPTDSLVMLTFEPGAFHARVDLPDVHNRDQWQVVTQVMVSPAVQHGHTRALLVVYTSDISFGRKFGDYLKDHFAKAGIDVPEVLVADGLRYWSSLAEAEPYRVEVNPLAQQVPVPAQSRADMAASLEPDFEARAKVLPHLVPSSKTRDEGVWVQAAVMAATPLSDRNLGRFASDMANEPLRDVAVATISENRGRTQVDFLIDCARRTPDSHAVNVYDMVALAAYLHGHGALTWCAVDRSRTYGDTIWAELLTLAMERALDPREWRAPTVVETLDALDGAA